MRAIPAVLGLAKLGPPPAELVILGMPDVEIVPILEITEPWSEPYSLRF